MKKNSILWAALSMTAALVMTACSNDDNDMTEAPVAPSTSKTIPYTVTVGGDEATTRATVDGNNKTLRFAAGDKLYITGTDIQGVLILQAGDEDKTTGATFSGELTYSGSGSPADDLSLTATLVSAQQTVGTQVSVDAPGAVTVNYPTAAYCSTISEAVQKFSRLTATSTYGAHAFTLAQQTAFLNFEITFDDGTTTGKTLSAVVSNGGSAVCTDNVTTTTVSEKVVAKFVLPVAAGTELSNATVTMGGKETISFGTSQTLTGKVYNITRSVADLSMVDCAGNWRTDGMWTANCYMVHTAGNYKLPLVYGNAIKAGAANTAAYTGVSGDNTTAIFPRHDGQAIAAPWIKNNGITVTQAELLWQDAEGLITAVGISGDYLTLTVGKHATTQEGNALVAAKDAEGNIVWSWHIWVTTQTFATLTTITASGYDYKVTPVNLGWVGDATSAIGGYNTYYQWGRKDAFKGTGSCTDENVYNISNAPVSGISYTNDKSVTIGGNIQHPTTFYNASYKPNTSTAYNLWDAQQTSNAENTAAATVKTVYDPCPPGFCVPTSGLYNYIKNQTVLASNNGCTYNNDVFFPASGCRGSSSGNLSSVGARGDYWSATPGSGDNGRGFNFDSESWELGNNRRAMGCPVRAVAE